MQVIEREDTVQTYNLFISHSWSYSDQYGRLIRLLDNRGYFRYRNYSVPPNDPIHSAATDAALRRAIQNHMQPCQVILVLAGVYATYSKWISIELELAQRGFATPKPIIAIAPWGSDRISAPVRRAADKVVGWNTESVERAIRELG